MRVSADRLSASVIFLALSVIFFPISELIFCPRPAAGPSGERSARPGLEPRLDVDLGDLDAGVAEQVLDLLERNPSTVHVSGRLALEVVEPQGRIPNASPTGVKGHSTAKSAPLRPSAIIVAQLRDMIPMAVRLPAERSV